MQLPNAHRAYVSRKKLTEYLLSLSHPSGASKALFFRAIGYSQDNADELAHGLRSAAEEGEVVGTLTSEFGTKYILEGRLDTPVGRSVTVTTVWITAINDDRPRFVTAYPSKR